MITLFQNTTKKFQYIFGSELIDFTLNFETKIQFKLNKHFIRHCPSNINCQLLESTNIKFQILFKIFNWNYRFEHKKSLLLNRSSIITQKNALEVIAYSQEWLKFKYAIEHEIKCMTNLDNYAHFKLYGKESAFQ